MPLYNTVKECNGNTIRFKANNLINLAFLNSLTTLFAVARVNETADLIYCLDRDFSENQKDKAMKVRMSIPVEQTFTH